MIYLKEGIEFKKLEELGFKQLCSCYEKENMSICINDRNISLVPEQICYGDDYILSEETVDLLYNLIKMDWVEKE